MPPSPQAKPNPKGFEAFVKRSLSPNIKNYKESTIITQQYGNSHIGGRIDSSSAAGVVEKSRDHPRGSDIRFFQNGHVYNSLPPLHQSTKNKIVPALRFSKSPTDIDFPIPPLSSDISGVDYYKHFKSDNKSLRDPISWDDRKSDSETIPNKPTITKTFNEILMSKFDKPAQQYIKDYMIHEKDTEKCYKDHKKFSSANENNTGDIVMLLSREEFKNGKARKSELKCMSKNELRKTLKIHGEEESILDDNGGFNKQIGPRQLRNLHKAELEREEFLKMKREVQRQKHKLMRVIENGYRSGVLNAEDNFGVFDKSSEELKEKHTRSIIQTNTRKELLQSKANSDLGRMTLIPTEDDNFSNSASDLFMKRKGRTELNEKMEGRKDIVIQKEEECQNAKRLEFIYNNQTRGKHYNIISGEDYPIENFLVK